MSRLRAFFAAKVSLIPPFNYLSLDSLEAGERFHIYSVGIRPVLKMLLCHGVSESQELFVLSRDRHNIVIRTAQETQPIKIRLIHAKHIEVQLEPSI